MAQILTMKQAVSLKKNTQRFTDNGGALQPHMAKMSVKYPASATYLY